MRYFIKQAARFFQGYSVSLLLFLETSFLSESTAKEKILCYNPKNYKKIF